MLAMDATKSTTGSRWTPCGRALPSFTGLVNVTVTAVTDHSGDLCGPVGANHTIPADDIVVAAGMKPQTERALSVLRQRPGVLSAGRLQEARNHPDHHSPGFAVASGFNLLSRNKAQEGITSWRLLVVFRRDRKDRHRFFAGYNRVSRLFPRNQWCSCPGPPEGCFAGNSPSSSTRSGASSTTRAGPLVSTNGRKKWAPGSSIMHWAK